MTNLINQIEQIIKTEHTDNVWATYEKCKRILRGGNLSPEQYQEGINLIVKELGI